MATGANIILIPLKEVLLYTTVGNYPQNETQRPMKTFQKVQEAKRMSVLNTIASEVIHVVIDPLDNSPTFLEMVKQRCVNAKRLTLDANLLGLTKKVYKKNNLKSGKNPNPEALLLKALTFISHFDQIEEQYLGPELNFIEEIYEDEKWGFSRRFNENAKFYRPNFASEIVVNFNPNLKVLFFGGTCVDSYDLRDVGVSCPLVMKALAMSQPSQLEEMEGGPSHICLNRLTNLKVLSMGYAMYGYHSDFVVELILPTLSGDFKVHQMFPNLRKLTVKMFCPFVFDMSGTANAGLYDRVTLDELEIEEQIPCFCHGASHLQAKDALLQSLLYASFKGCKPIIKRGQGNDCLCTNVASIGLLKSLKIIKIRCFDETVARFIRKLHQINSAATIIIYEQSRFERNSDHHSVWDNLQKLNEIITLVAHDKIKIVMKQVKGMKLKKVEAKLAEYIPDGVEVSFTK